MSARKKSTTLIKTSVAEQRKKSEPVTPLSQETPNSGETKQETEQEAPTKQPDKPDSAKATVRRKSTTLVKTSVAERKEEQAKQSESATSALSTSSNGTKGASPSNSAAKLRASVASTRVSEPVFTRAELMADLKADSPKAIDISKEQTGAIQYGREPCTVKLDRFKELVKKIREAKTRKVCTKFWDFMETSLEPFHDKEIGHGHSKEFKDFNDFNAEEKQGAAMGRLLGIRPFMEFDCMQMADLVNDDEVTANDVLNECLTAAHLGVMRMNFGVACIRCNGHIGSHDSIAKIPESGDCPSCTLPNTNNSLDRVRVRFMLDQDTLYAPRIFPPCHMPGALMAKAPCMPKVLFPTTQFSAYEYTVDLPQGDYVMTCPVSDMRLKVKVEAEFKEDADRLDLVLAATTISKGQKSILVEHGKLKVKALADTPSIAVHIWLPDHDYSDLSLPKEEIAASLTGTDILNTPRFQELFGDQVLSGNQKFEVGNAVLCFTDLLDSTRQYTRLGDAKALQLVQDHFEIIFATIAEEGGRVVKTIGDAVMCSFTSVERCIRATSKAMQQMLEYTDDPSRCPEGGHMHLKTGIHMGHTLMVPLNGVNDYFGQTVNIAARVQGKAETDEIIVSEAAMKDIGAEACLEKLVKEGVMEKVYCKGFELKGVDGKPELTSYKVLPFKKEGGAKKADDSKTKEEEKKEEKKEEAKDEAKEEEPKKEEKKEEAKERRRTR